MVNFAVLLLHMKSKLRIPSIARRKREEDHTSPCCRADQALCCCWAPGNTPIQPDVKTIQLTREFPYLPSESECRLSPFLSVCLSVCVSLFSLPLALIPSMEKRASQNTHSNGCCVYTGMSSYCGAKRVNPTPTNDREDWIKHNNAK